MVPENEKGQKGSQGAKRAERLEIERQSEVGYRKMERWGKGGIAKRGAYEVRGVSLLTYDTPHRRKTAEQSATDTTDVKQKKDNLSIILSGGA